MADVLITNLQKTEGFGSCVSASLSKPLHLSNSLGSWERGLPIPLSSATRQLCKSLGLPGVLPDPLRKAFREKGSKTQQKNKTAWKINCVSFPWKIKCGAKESTCGQNLYILRWVLTSPSAAPPPPNTHTEFRLLSKDIKREPWDQHRPQLLLKTSEL